MKDQHWAQFDRILKQIGGPSREKEAKYQPKKGEKAKIALILLHFFFSALLSHIISEKNVKKY